MVRQVVGVGSVGMQVYLVLLEGRTGADPLFLQVKQAGPSVYEAHTRPSRHDNHGARVIAASDCCRAPPISSSAGARCTGRTTTSGSSGT